jgi:hypothetical protein
LLFPQGGLAADPVAHAQLIVRVVMPPMHAGRTVSAMAVRAPNVMAAAVRTMGVAVTPAAVFAVHAAMVAAAIGMRTVAALPLVVSMMSRTRSIPDVMPSGSERRPGRKCNRRGERHDAKQATKSHELLPLE